MSPAELIIAAIATAKGPPVPEERVQAFHKMIEETQREFDERMEQTQMTAEHLRRSYSI